MVVILVFIDCAFLVAWQQVSPMMTTVSVFYEVSFFFKISFRFILVRCQTLIWGSITWSFINPGWTQSNNRAEISVLASMGEELREGEEGEDLKEWVLLKGIHNNFKGSCNFDTFLKNPTSANFNLF